MDTFVKSNDSQENIVKAEQTKRQPYITPKLEKHKVWNMVTTALSLPGGG